MSIWTKLVSWWKWVGENAPAPTHLTRSVVAMPPPPPTPEPEVSCFVKGIIRSMQEKPEEWIGHSYSYLSRIDVYHKPSGINLALCQSLSGCKDNRRSEKAYGVYIVDGPDMTKLESDLIVRTYFRVTKERAEAKRAAKEVSIRAIFEPLGCPPSTPNQS